jgi:glycosyltransferase involved in cell wall biosynthesis
MKIIYVVESLTRGGGAENAVVNLCIELKKLDHDPLIVHLWSPNNFEHELNTYGVKTHCLDMKSRWDIRNGLLKLHRILFNHEAQIINAFNFFPMFYVALSKLSVRSKKRIVTYHNMGYEVYPANTPWRFARKALDIFLNKFFFDGHLGVSNAVSTSYSKHLRIHSIPTVENIIPVNSISSITSKDERMLDEERNFKIIMAGRLVHEKGYKYMIKAVEALNKDNIPFHLSIFGDGPLKKDILSEISLKQLSDKISIIPTVSHKDLFQAIKLSDVFVMSSISEGFPMAPAEAMVLGVPVVATRVGGIPELIEDGVSGLLVPPRDSKILAKTIKNVLQDNHLKEMLASNGKKRIVEKFSPSIICNKLINYYQQVLEK